MKEKDKSILITGASSGIGLATANHLNQAEFNIFAGIRNIEAKDTLHQDVIPLSLDVTDHQSIEQAFTEMTSIHGVNELDGLVCNAGVPIVGPIEQLNTERFRTVLEVNVLGTISLVQRALPFLRKSQGKIIVMSSISGKIALPFQGGYCASKFATEAIADALRVELRPWNIQVIVLEPGNVTTPIRNKALSNLNADTKLLSEKQIDLYRAVYDFARNHAERDAIAPELVAQRIEKILRSNRPKNRYLIGKDATVLGIISKLPAAIRDHILSSKLPKYGS